MKIAFLNFARDFGGGEHWTILTAGGLSEHGHQVLLLGRSGSTYQNRVNQAGLQYMSVPAGPDYNPITILYLLRIFLYFRPDVLIVSHNKDVRNGAVAALFLGIPVLHRNGFPILKDTWRHRLTYALTNRIITNSQRIRDQYADIPWIDPNTIDVVPNGIDPPETIRDKQQVRSNLNLAQDAFIVMFAGRLTTTKHVDDLITAMKLMPETSSVRLAVMGDGPEAESLKQQAANLVTSNRVVFLGYHDDAADKLMAADLVILPSDDEGMPNTLMEAMVRKIPVAATPVGDVPYLLDEGKAGWLFPVGSPEKITELLASLENHQDLLDEMASAGFKQIRDHFSFSDMISGVERSCRRTIRVRRDRT